MTDEYLFIDGHGNVRKTTVTDHVARGRCSGIPECCIKYFVNKVVNGTAKYDQVLDWGYRPCTTCALMNKRVQVRSCADNDGRDCTCGAWKNSEVIDMEAPKWLTEVLLANESRSLDSAEDREAVAQALAGAFDNQLDQLQEQIAAWVEGSGLGPVVYEIARRIRQGGWH